MKNYITILFVFTAIIHCNSQSYSWTAQAIPTNQNLRAITHLDENTWIAVGDDGTILRTNNNGNSWEITSTHANEALLSVSFNGNTGIAVGELGRIIKTTDGGKNWVEILRPTHKNLNSVVIGSTMTVAVGEEGSIFVSYNDGQSWTPHSTGNQSNIFGLTVKDFSALALGSHGTMSITTDNGNVWGTTVHGDQSTTFYSSSFISNTTGWAVGSTSSGNIILHTTNSGVNWTGQIAFTNEPLFGVNFLSPDTGFAVGANGTIIYSSDGGNNWQNQYSGTYESINSISFINSKFGYAVGNNGLLLKGNMGNMTNTDHNSISNSAGIYPNPIKGYDALSIHIPSSYPAEINICNLLGESVLKEVLLADFQNININQLVNGIYMVDIHSKSGHDIKKLVIQR